MGKIWGGEKGVVSEMVLYTDQYPDRVFCDRKENKKFRMSKVFCQSIEM